MKVKIEFNKNKSGVYHINGLHGYIEITQTSETEPTTFLVAVGGLSPNKLHGFHIHESPVKNLGDLNKSCDSCGGHFNPTGKNHGSILNPDGGLDRHVGDLINNLKADSQGNCVIEFQDSLACLLPSYDKNYSILGKSIVIHEDTDDLGREGITKDIPFLISRSSHTNKIRGSVRVLKPSEKYKSKKKKRIE